MPYAGVRPPSGASSILRHRKGTSFRVHFKISVRRREEFYPGCFLPRYSGSLDEPFDGAVPVVSLLFLFAHLDQSQDSDCNPKEVVDDAK